MILLTYTSVISHSSLNHYDNFSHWAKIVKFLFFEQRLPQYSDNFIGFLSYPLGSSLFINYFVNIVGFSEGNMLVGQFLLISASLISLFGLIKNQKGKYYYLSVMLLIIGSFYYFNISRIDELLVDFLMPIIGVGYISGIYLNRSSISAMSLFTSIVGSQLILVKNSAGLFMGAGVIVYLWLSLRKIRTKDFDNKIIVLNILVTPLVIMLTYLSWSWHSNNIIDPNSIPKHTVNFSSYADIFNSKTPEVVGEIISLFTQRLIDITNPPTIGLLMVTFLYFLSHLILKYILIKRSKIMYFFFYNLIIVVTYYLGLLATYLYSMPTGEALALAAFNRYSYTIVIFSLGLFTISFLVEFQKNKLQFFLTLKKLFQDMVVFF